MTSRGWVQHGRLDHHEYHLQRPFVGVDVAVRAVCIEQYGSTVGDLMDLVAHLQGEGSGLDRDEFARAFGVALGVVAITGGEIPTPELDVFAPVGADQEVSRGTLRSGPQPHDLCGFDDPDAGAIGQFYELGEGDAEGVGEPTERGDARVGSGLLDLHEHAFAHTGTAGELVQGPAAAAAEVAGVAGNGGGNLVGIGHRLTLPR